MVTRLQCSTRRCIAIVAVFGTAIAFWLAATSAAAQSVSDREVLNLDEAATLLRVKPEVIRTLAESQQIPARLVGDEWRFWQPALLEWLKGEPGASDTSELPGHSTDWKGSQIPLRESINLTARGIGPGSTTSQPELVPAVSPQSSSTQTTVGDRPSNPTSQDIALRDRVLLGRGASTIDFGFAYGRSERSLIPVIRDEEKDIGVIGTLRYGLLDDLQITARVEAMHQ